MRCAPLLGLLVVGFLAGCATRNPLSPIQEKPADYSHTFVLRSFEDPRLPEPMAEVSGALLPEGAEPQLGFESGRKRRFEDPASHWNRLTTELATAGRLPPPLFSRAYALTHVAIYDALIAAGDARRGRLRANTVAAAAAAEVLAYLFPADADRIRADADAQAGRRKGANARAWALGRAVGLLVVDQGRHDGSDATFTGTIPIGPGFWSGQNPVLPMCGTWRCWVATSGTEFLPEPPYAYGSPEDLREVQEVLDASLHRTPEQIAIVHKWADQPPPAIWNGILLPRVASHRLDGVASARAFAFLNVAMFDAFVSCWSTKYTYWVARPFQRSPGLVTVITTPNFPSYTSGHSTISAAASVVMSALFRREGRFFQAEAEEAAISRFWGGIHFRHDNDQGLIVGRSIGEKVVALMRSDRDDSIIAAR